MKKMLGFFSAVAVLTAILWGCQCASEPAEGIVDIPPAPPTPKRFDMAERNMNAGVQTVTAVIAALLPVRATKNVSAMA